MSKPCKHKFEPRYDFKWTTPVEEVTSNGYDIKCAANIEPYLKTKTYIHDICIRCGDIKERAKDGKEEKSI